MPPGRNEFRARRIVETQRTIIRSPKDRAIRKQKVKNGGKAAFGLCCGFRFN